MSVVNYCEVPRKHWIVSYGGGKTCVAKLISDHNAQTRFPELVFDYEGKEFKVQFYNQSEWIAARDSGILVRCHVIGGKNKSRFEGTIIHKQIN